MIFSSETIKHGISQSSCFIEDGPLKGQNKGQSRKAEGIAAAKAKGVKYGRPPKPLPHNFHEVHRAWRAKKMTLKQAAEACNMPVGTFYDKARKFENIA